MKNLDRKIERRARELRALGNLGEDSAAVAATIAQARQDILAERRKKAPRTRLKPRRTDAKSEAYREQCKMQEHGLRIRCSFKCENPFCRRVRALDPHHIDKRRRRSPGFEPGQRDHVENKIMLCRACHQATDLPAPTPMVPQLAILPIGSPDDRAPARDIWPPETFRIYERHFSTAERNAYYTRPQ